MPAPPIVVTGPYKLEDKEVTYKGHDPASKTFVTIGERIHCISPAIRKAMDSYDEGPILKRAAEQIAAGATYLDVNIGPAESNGPELMKWAVQLLQQNFNNVPLALDTANQKAIEAASASTTAPTASPSSTPPTPAAASATSIWPPPTTPSSSPCAPPTASPRTTRSG